MTATQPVESPDSTIASIDDFRQRRTVAALLPSGLRVRLRPVNMEMYALSGGLPLGLRRLAGMETEEFNRVLVDEEASIDALKDVQDYMTHVVRLMVAEPDLSGEVDLDALLLPADFHWLLQVAQREVDVDAEGRRLWVVEPLSRWGTFRSEHGCPENCQACVRVQAAFSAAWGR